MYNQFGPSTDPVNTSELDNKASKGDSQTDHPQNLDDEMTNEDDNETATIQS